MKNDWQQRAVDRKDFRHSDRYEDWEDVKHKRKHSKTCKRNKGKPHDYAKVIKHYSWSQFTWYVLECTKCGKQNWRNTTPV